MVWAKDPVPLTRSKAPESYRGWPFVFGLAVRGKCRMFSPYSHSRSKWTRHFRTCSSSWELTRRSRRFGLCTSTWSRPWQADELWRSEKGRWCDRIRWQLCGRITSPLLLVTWPKSQCPLGQTTSGHRKDLRVGSPYVYRSACTCLLFWFPATNRHGCRKFFLRRMHQVEDNRKLRCSISMDLGYHTF